MVDEKALTKREFDLLRKFVYTNAGISLSDQKMALVQGRLSKRLRTLGMNSYKQYYDHLVSDDTGDELIHLIDAISTNVTSFFRERGQWEYLKIHVEDIFAKRSNSAFRIWSAGCSSGEEPYSIAMFLLENLPAVSVRQCKILATDISADILRRATSGRYVAKNVEPLPKNYVSKYFDRDRKSESYQIKAFVREMVLFRLFNLVYGNFSLFTNPFDMIFCRNVMIYFDTPTRDKLIAEFARVLPPGGLLFIGHSESLTRNNKLFRMIQPSIYERIG